MVNIAVFASGSGTNFETILSHIEDGSLHVNCACLIADKENAYARVRARNHGVEEFYFNPKGYDGKAGYEAAILEVLKEKLITKTVNIIIQAPTTITPAKPAKNANCSCPIIVGKIKPE